MPVLTTEKPLDKKVEVDKRPIRRIDPIISKYREEGLLGVRAGAVKSKDGKEITLEEAVKNADAEKSETATQSPLRNSGLILEKLGIYRRELSKMRRDAIIQNVLLEIIGMGAVITLGGYITINSSLRSPLEPPGIGIGAALIISGIIGAYFIDRVHRGETKHIKSANRILDSVEKGKCIHTEDDVKNVNMEYSELYNKMKTYMSELAPYSDVATNIADDLNTFVQQK